MKKFAAALLATLCLSPAAFADEIKIEGGGTAIITVFRPLELRYEKVHGHTLNIVQSSAVKGLIALSQGKVDIATGAHPLEDLIAGAAKEGVVIDKSTLVATAIAENQLVVIANRASEVARLSKEQLKGIFTGKITNWKEVGGKDMPIKVVWGEETKGQNVQFTRVALDEEPVTPNTVHARTYRNIVEVVGRTTGSVGVVPLEITTPVTRSIDTISITSPIWIITKGAPTEVIQTVIDFYRAEYGFLK